jgi:nucleotide-binding universal stress UspA family protein
MPRRLIVHPTDLTPGSEAAFLAAIALARRDGASLIVVHVLEPPSPILADRSSAHYSELMSAGELRADTILERMTRRAGQAGVPATDVLLEGSPPEQIARLARRRHADLIVLGTRRHAGLRAIVLGSTAERVIGLAHCPVLTVRSGRRASSRRGPGN